MGPIQNLSSFDPDRDDLTNDFEVARKGTFQGRRIVPQKDARSLKQSFDRATAKGRSLLDAAASGDEHAFALLEKSDPDIADILNATFGPPAPPDITDLAREQIAVAFDREIELESAGQIPDCIDTFIIEQLLSRESLPEENLHQIAKLATEHPDWFSRVDPALVQHIIQTSHVLNAGTFEQAAVGKSTSGVYFGAIGGNKKIVVKPRCEEYLAPYNPYVDGITLIGALKVTARGELKSPIRPGYFSGDGAQREALAYVTDLLDGHYGRTPPTLFVDIRHRDPMVDEGTPKECSIQAFVSGQVVKPHHHAGMDRQSLEGVAYTDIDEGNTDRYLLGNLFVQEGGKAQRIDQALTRGEDPKQCRFDWSRFPQLARPMSRFARDAIERQDLPLRLGILKESGLSDTAITLERERILFKKAAAKADLTFFDIAAILVPQKDHCAFAKLIEGSGNFDHFAQHIALEKRALCELFLRNSKAASEKAEASEPHLKVILKKQVEILSESSAALTQMGGANGLRDKEIAQLTSALLEILANGDGPEPAKQIQTLCQSVGVQKLELIHTFAKDPTVAVMRADKALPPLCAGSAPALSFTNAGVSKENYPILLPCSCHLSTAPDRRASL